MADKFAHIAWAGSPDISLTIDEPTLGNPTIDISPLAKYGCFTFDPGFMATASCESKITYIDGDAGVLLHRGYPIDKLASQKDFLDVAYLLLNEDLPNEKEKADFQNSIQEHSRLDDSFQTFFQGFKRHAHPMGMLTSLAGALSAFYDEVDLHSNEARYLAAIRMIAKIPTLVAMCYRHHQGLAFIPPQRDFSYAQNFLNMMFGVEPLPVVAHAMDVIFTLHADHEQNASTSTVRLAGSTGTNPYSCLAAGLSALWGPAHGGANEACLKMLTTIGDISHIPEYIARAKDKNDPFRLMGFGHRVYKNHDPRATIMRKVCHDVLEATGKQDNPLFKLAMALEKIALEDTYFVERKLYPNIDFYSGITLAAIGIPSNMFTAIFALARTSGWMAQWFEMTSSAYKIGRPRQLYTGHTTRNVP